METREDVCTCSVAQTSYDTPLDSHLVILTPLVSTTCRCFSLAFSWQCTPSSLMVTFLIVIMIFVDFHMFSMVAS